MIPYQYWVGGSWILKIKLRNKSSKIKYLDLKYTIGEKFLRIQQTLSDG